ncbi:hypothetical protein EPN28_04430 [Patescibacteria group bacterium]|nr:MAG: hypothetical protein EPN28_04430 [Patescibacteria group bacterium]
MLSYIWFTFLYQPLFNALVWLYVNVAHQNLGWAVVWLTIFLRVLLLPFTIISYRDVGRQEKAQLEALKAARAYQGDLVAQKEIIRDIMRKNRISPWAKVLTLGVQLLVLVLLYQVFVRGITGEKVIKILYPSIDFPGKINTEFYGFDIGARHDFIWAGAAALYLFISIMFASRHRKHWDGASAVYVVLFPLATFFALWLLPMVKSLFILTTMIFSDTISVLKALLFPAKKT